MISRASRFAVRRCACEAVVVGWQVADASITEASAEYITSLFDEYAATFDQVRPPANTPHTPSHITFSSSTPVCYYRTATKGSILTSPVRDAEY
eukprot:775119-Rhodomonas_salina.1